MAGNGEAARGSGGMRSWNYVVTAHKPTVVTPSCVGNFTAPDHHNLIVSYCVLHWDGSKSELLTRSEGDASDYIGRPIDKGQIGAIDPHCCLIGLHLYDGVFKQEERLLEEVARDYNTTWMTAVEMLDDDVYIGADNGYNLFTVLKPDDADVNGRLLVIGQYHLGDYVNRFHHGPLVVHDPGSEIAQIPTVIFGTASGAIGVIASLPQYQHMFFEQLQSVLADYIKSVGNLSHLHWRSFCDDRSIGVAQAFVDGDLIESSLSLEPSKMEEVARMTWLDADEL